MVSLNKLNSGTPGKKPWLKIVAESVEVDKSYQVSVLQNVTTTPSTLTPPNWINAIVYTYGSDIVVNTPSSDDLKTYFGEQKQAGFSFVVYVYKRDAFNTTLTLGNGTFEYKAGGGSISLSTLNGIKQLYLRYITDGSGAWTIFY